MATSAASAGSSTGGGGVTVFEESHATPATHTTSPTEISMRMGHLTGGGSRRYPVAAHPVPRHSPADAQPQARRPERIATIERRGIEHPAPHRGDPPVGQLHERLHRPGGAAVRDLHRVPGGMDGPAGDPQNAVLEVGSHRAERIRRALFLRALGALQAVVRAVPPGAERGFGEPRVEHEEAAQLRGTRPLDEPVAAVAVVAQRSAPLELVRARAGPVLGRMDLGARALHFEARGGAPREAHRPGVPEPAGDPGPLAGALRLVAVEPGPLELRRPDRDPGDRHRALEDLGVVMVHRVAQHRALIKRILAMIRTVGLTPPLMLSGGVARNQAICRMLKEATGAHVVLPRQPQLMGAYGAALIARDNSTHATDKE